MVLVWLQKISEMYKRTTEWEIDLLELTVGAEDNDSVVDLCEFRVAIPSLIETLLYFTMFYFIGVINKQMKKKISIPTRLSF